MADPGKGKWTVLIPVANLVLSSAVNYEFRIDRVTLVRTEKLQGRRKRLGLPMRISEMRYAKRHFLTEAPVMAVVHVTGQQKQLQRELVTLVRDELAILAASQLGYAKRHQTSAPAPVGERSPSRRSQFWIDAAGIWTQPNQWYGPIHNLHLGDNWLTFQRQVFFLKLLRLLRGHERIAKAWRRDLRRAAVLIGLSQMASSVADAFLWNMIALELLMTKQGDTVGESLPSRAEALIGWSKEWTEDGFEAKIRKAYDLRCLMVHQGDRESPSREDLFFTDDLLLCLLTNLVAHPKLFSSKDDVVAFSRRVEAEQLLGAKPRVRPKSLQMLRREYRPKDYEVY
jgi:hypothetical protein